MIGAIKTEKQLLEELQKDDAYDAIVVEGYDGVGKGRILNILSDLYGVTPYRPDYNLWQRYDHRPQDRWKVSGFFWDVFSHFNRSSLPLATPMLFDRGVLSGAVYNDDINIARDYKSLLRDKRVLHILVTCEDRDSYHKFAEVRGVESLDYDKCVEYTRKYLRAITESGVEFLVYANSYDPDIVEYLSNTCSGCGHYSYGVCRHPLYNNKKVYENSPRCEHSSDKEVQDSATEMHVM